MLRNSTDSHIQAILEDFVFLDCRIGDHPELHGTVYWAEGDYLVCAATTFAATTPVVGTRIRASEGFLSYAIRNQRAIYVEDPALPYDPLQHPDFAERSRISSLMAIPITLKRKTVGVLSVHGTQSVRFCEPHLVQMQPLAALLAYEKYHLQGERPKTPTPASQMLGTALCAVREASRETQSGLATRIGTSRIALSRWEGGSQPPTRGPLLRWCKALGLLAGGEAAVVRIVDVSPELLRELRQNPEAIHALTPDKFELLVADLLRRMGYLVSLTGSTFSRDGGIDLVAVPRNPVPGGFLIAGQVKHHRNRGNVSRADVDRLLAWKGAPFHIGLLATNTAFSRDARWLAELESNKTFLRLRGFEDLSNWIKGEIWSPTEWRELPKSIQLAPGVSVRVPRPSIEELRKTFTLPLDTLDSGEFE